MSVLVIAEHDNKDIAPSTLSTITAAGELSKEITVLVAGLACQTVCEQVSQINFVNKVLYMDDKLFEHALAEPLGNLIKEIGSDFSHILAPASTFGKNVMPRVAAILDVAQISEITKVLSEDTFVRPIYAGNALETVQSEDPIKVLTVRPTAFEVCSESDTAAQIEMLSNTVTWDKSEFVSKEHVKSGRPELTAAKVVVAGGRGLQSAEQFKLLDKLADKLNAAIGASRAAVDAGFVPNEYQVGQTGKVVAPDLYIAIGISGAIQHLAGMKDSKVIVAINKDGEAPIFQIADYGLVGDLFEIVPELIQKLSA